MPRVERPSRRIGGMTEPQFRRAISVGLQSRAPGADGPPKLHIARTCAPWHACLVRRQRLNNTLRLAAYALSANDHDAARRVEDERRG
jgi:hypothetical protein